MLTNKHVITALIVTPILALIAYFAVDMVVSEKPHQAKAGASYPLVVKSNCRYQSGRCSLVNGDVQIELSLATSRLIIEGSHAMSGLVLALSDGQNVEHAMPVSQTQDSQQRRWFADLPTILTDQHKLRIAAKVNDSTYFAEADTVFIEYQTSFDSTNIERR